MRCRDCLFDPCACGSENYPTEEETWFSIICLGTRPLAYGPFQSEEAAMNWLTHTHAVMFCFNGVVEEDHHVLPLQ